ncbi:MAG: hypothetical protein ACOZAI_04370 [Pseudomonadota bacterium]
MKDMNRLLIPGVVLLAGALHGCGGGGDDDDSSIPSVPTSPASITSANYVSIAGDAYAAIGEFIQLGRLSTLGVASASGREAAPREGLLELTLDIAKRRLGDSSGDAVYPATVYSDNLDCVSGSGTVSWNDADESGTLSAGDTWRETYSSCQISADGTILNGTLTLTVNSVAGDPSTRAADWSFNVDADYASLRISEGSESMTFDGGYTIAATYVLATNTETQNVTGRTLTTTWTDSEGTGIARLTNFSLAFSLNLGMSTYSADADYTLASSELGGVIAVVTNPAFGGAMDGSGNMGNPTSGTMVMIGANSAKARIEAQSDGVSAMVSLDADGDGTYETGQSVPWTTLSP